MLKYLKQILQLVLSPSHGWDDVEQTSSADARILTHGFYPLTAVTALSACIFPQKTVLQTIEDVIITFFMFFVGYFIGLFCLSVTLPKYSETRPISDAKIRNYVALTTGMLEIIWLLSNFVPATIPLTWFLPVYVLIVAWRGAKYLDIKSQLTMRFMVVVMISIILSPYIFRSVFSLFLPI